MATVTQKIRSNKTLVIVLSILLLAVIIFIIYKVYTSYGYGSEYNTIIDKSQKGTHVITNAFRKLKDCGDDGSDDKSGYQVYSSDKLSNGDSYTYTFWIKINDMNFKYGQAKHIFHRGDKDAKSVNPGVWIYPNTNNLMIRIDTYGIQLNTNKTKNGRQCQYWSSQFPHSHKFTETNYPNKDLGYHNNCRNPNNDKKGDWCLTTDPDVKKEYCSVKDYKKPVNMNACNMNVSEFNADDKCDIVNIPIQTWVHVAISLYGRTLDVYLDGELARSCKYSNPPRINNDDIHILDHDGFDGNISDMRYYDKPLSASKIRSIYKKGHK